MPFHPCLNVQTSPGNEYILFCSMQNNTFIVTGMNICDNDYRNKYFSAIT
jgi:hypothetical protein